MPRFEKARRSRERSRGSVPMPDASRDAIVPLECPSPKLTTLPPCYAHGQQPSPCLQRRDCGMVLERLDDLRTRTNI